jgi:hypothetical protein
MNFSIFANRQRVNVVRSTIEASANISFLTKIRDKLSLALIPPLGTHHHSGFPFRGVLIR